MSIINASPLLGAGTDGYQIERSLRFNNADSAYLSKGSTLSGNRRLHTLSFWVKRAGLGSRQTLFGNTNSSGFNGLYFEFDGNDALLIGDYTTGWVWQLNTTARYRDPSAWYHIVFAVDTANATASNRARLYVNGVEVTAFSTASYMSQNYDTYWNYNASAIGRLGDYNGQYFSGYLTEINFIDGQALTPSSFGETDTITGVWKPKRYSGTYGTNGFKLTFSDNSGTTSTTLGKDSSGNGNNWTPNNFSVTAGAGNDSLIDTPTPYADGGNGRGNYATLNPLFNTGILGYFWLTNGNLTAVEQSGSAAWRTRWSTIGITSGKFYAEFTISYSGSASIVSGNGAGVGLYDGGTATYVGETSTSYGYLVNGQKYNNNSGVSYGATYTNGDVIGVAYDADAGTLTFYKNGVSQGVAYSSIPSRTYFFAASAYWVYPDGVTNIHANFGQRPFAYTPPSGFLALNTQNLPEPLIKKPSSYMDVLTWSGTGGGSGATRSLTGLGFSPDLVWQKARSSGTNHRLLDAVRGAGTGKTLSSNTTSAEGDGGSSESLYGYLSSFDSNGFTLTNGTSTFDNGNKSGDTYVAWCWDESATPGFDIVTYAGTGVARTVSHSLGVAPKMMIVKNRTTAGTSWAVYTEMTGAGNYLRLNSTIASTAGSTFWNSTAPTSSVFSVGTDSDVNANTNEHVAYLWSEVAGFSKFGSYTGNGSTDGPFVFCGFRPRWVILKRTDSLGAWDIHDAARDPDNVVDQLLEAQNSNAEASYSAYSLDFVSNGFKLRGNGASQNASGGTFVFAAFAESPAKYSLAR